MLDYAKHYSKTGVTSRRSPKLCLAPVGVFLHGDPSGQRQCNRRLRRDEDDEGPQGHTA